MSSTKLKPNCPTCGLNFPSDCKDEFHKPDAPKCDGKSQCADFDCDICGNKEFAEKALGRTTKAGTCERCGKEKCAATELYCYENHTLVGQPIHETHCHGSCLPAREEGGDRRALAKKNLLFFAESPAGLRGSMDEVDEELRQLEAQAFESGKKEQEMNVIQQIYDEVEKAKEEGRRKGIEESREAVENAFNPIEKIVPCAGIHCQCDDSGCFRRDTADNGMKVSLAAITALLSGEGKE